jgi:hypothetical protein
MAQQAVLAGSDSERDRGTYRHSTPLWRRVRWLQEYPLEAVVGVLPERPWHFALDPQYWPNATPPAAS